MRQWRDHGVLTPLMAAQRIGLQLRRTALTASAEAQRPDARMLPRVDRNALFGVSCKPLLVGASSMSALDTLGRVMSALIHTR